MKEHDSERHEMAIDFAFKSLTIIVEWVARIELTVLFLYFNIKMVWPVLIQLNILENKIIQV